MSYLSYDFISLTDDVCIRKFGSWSYSVFNILSDFGNLGCPTSNTVLFAGNILVTLQVSLLEKYLKLSKLHIIIEYVTIILNPYVHCSVKCIIIIESSVVYTCEANQSR